MDNKTIQVLISIIVKVYEDVNRRKAQNRKKH